MSQTNTANNKIGALWNKTSGAGREYMSGEITVEGKKLSIVVFPNNPRPGKNDPNFQILLATKPAGTPAAPATQQAKPAANKPAPKVKTGARPAQPVLDTGDSNGPSDDDVPF